MDAEVEAEGPERAPHADALFEQEEEDVVGPNVVEYDCSDPVVGVEDADYHGNFSRYRVEDELALGFVEGVVGIHRKDGVVLGVQRPVEVGELLGTPFQSW